MTKNVPYSVVTVIEGVLMQDVVTYLKLDIIIEVEDTLVKEESCFMFTNRDIIGNKPYCLYIELNMPNMPSKLFQYILE